MSALTAPADQGLAAAQLAEQARQHIAAAQQAAAAAEAAARQAEQMRNGS